MLEVNPDERLSAEEVLSHPWVNEEVIGQEDLHENISKQLSTGQPNFIQRKPDGPAVVRLIAVSIYIADSFIPLLKIVKKKK